MKPSIIRIILLLCIALIAGAGSCNRTSIRNETVSLLIDYQKTDGLAAGLRTSHGMGTGRLE